MIYNIFFPLDLSESEKDITTSNEVEYLTDIFQTEDDGDSGKCKVKNDYLVQYRHSSISVVSISAVFDLPRFIILSYFPPL